MSQPTTIEWATHSWNPTRGCSRISPGCQNCYAERIAGRFSTHSLQDGDHNGGVFAGFATMNHGKAHWTGKVELIEEKLLEPLRWRKPRPRVFVNSMSDLFHEALPYPDIDKVFGVMALCPESTFLVLTKRAERMFSYMDSTIRSAIPGDSHWSTKGPLPNVWLGVSVENQKYADERIPWLLKTPAAVRFVSYEPALGPLDLTRVHIQSPVFPQSALQFSIDRGADTRKVLDWVIAGGESGPEARPPHPDWFRSVRDQCAAAGVAFFFKQWGEFGPVPGEAFSERLSCRMVRTGDVCVNLDGSFETFDGKISVLNEGTGFPMRSIGKKSAGRLLDGVEHNGFPQ